MKQGSQGYFTEYPEYQIYNEKADRSGNDIAIIWKTTGSHVHPEIEERETVTWIAKIEHNQVTEWRIFSDMDHIKLIRSGIPRNKPKHLAAEKCYWVDMSIFKRMKQHELENI